MPSVPPINKAKEIKEASEKTYNSTEELMSHLEKNGADLSKGGEDHIHLKDIRVMSSDIIDEVTTKYKDAGYTTDIGLQEGADDNVYSIDLRR